MKAYIIKYSSYQETLDNLVEYHKEVIDNIRNKFEFPMVSAVPFIALRKNVEIGFLYSPLIEWEQEAAFQYGKKPVFEQYYPVVLDFVRNTIIPKKNQDYACNISYCYIFPPCYHKEKVYSFFVNFFEKPIFKNFNVRQNILEQDIVVYISAFFRKANKHGPEQISVAILDNKFITIMVSGLLTPFLKIFIKNNVQDVDVIKNFFLLQAESMLQQVFAVYFNTPVYRPSIFFDVDNDKLIILTSLSEDIWGEFLDGIYI